VIVTILRRLPSLQVIINFRVIKTYRAPITEPGYERPEGAGLFLFSHFSQDIIYTLRLAGARCRLLRRLRSKPPRLISRRINQRAVRQVIRNRARPVVSLHDTNGAPPVRFREMYADDTRKTLQSVRPLCTCASRRAEARATESFSNLCAVVQLFLYCSRF